MKNISLICMPFADPFESSLALHQLKSAVEIKSKDKVHIDILYLNHDFMTYFGTQLYSYANSMRGILTGFGDWFFRPSVFPDAPDNTDIYFQYFGPESESFAKELRQIVDEKRSGINDFFDTIIDRYALENSGIAGFTSAFYQNMASFSFAGKLKATFPDMITVMGGPNCENPMGFSIIRNIEAMDYVFSGPGLKSFPQFVRTWLDGKIDDLEKIDGIISKNNVKQREQQHASGNLESMKKTVGADLDINTFLDLDYDIYFDSLNRHFPDNRRSPILFFETSRGCWWADRSPCTFCALTGGEKYRAMDEDMAVAQFQQMFKYSDRCRFFEAVDRIIPPDYAEKVFPRVSPPENATVVYEVRTTLSRREMDQLSRAGVKAVQPGIESLSTRILKLMKKGTTAFQNLTFLKNCRLTDIYPGWNLLIAVPGEDEQVYEKYFNDFPSFFHLPPPGAIFPIQFQRGNHYFRNPDEYKLKLTPYPFYQMIYPFDEASLNNIAFYFEHQFDLNDARVQAITSCIGRLFQEVGHWQASWNNGTNPAPELYLKTDNHRHRIYDSRFAKPVHHDIDDADLQILKILEKPSRPDDLSRLSAQGRNNELEQRLKRLTEKRLIFKENNRYLNLVFFEKPGEMTVSPNALTQNYDAD